VARWSNVETMESGFPLIYLYRRYLEDTGGHGRNRGGSGHEWAAMPLEAAGEVEANTFGKGGIIPHGMGLFGGTSGATLNYRIFYDTNAWENGLEFPFRTDREDEIEYEEKETATWGSFSISDGDVFYLNYAGSGGYGDPLERDPEKVAEDVADGSVTPETAERLYGVPVSEDGEYDEEAVETKRQEIIQERLDDTDEYTSPIDASDVTTTGYHLGEYIDVVEGPDGGQYSACNSCDTVFAPVEDNWKDHVIVQESMPTKAGKYRESHEDLRYREFICHDCGQLLDSNNALKEDRYLHDQLHL
jgi:N-methylhydantoinase B